MGMVLGILCAGILLVAHTPEVIHVVGQPISVLARFIFLVSVGLSFGLGAALTGAIHVNKEKGRPEKGDVRADPGKEDIIRVET